jgi:hypothetical protein
MRRVPTDDNLAAVPVGGLIEICQDSQSSGSDNASEQFIDASLIGSAAAIDTLNYSETETVVAIAGGGTTGLITATSEYVTVTSDGATKAVSLPAAVAGKRMKIVVPSTGCELISVVAGDKVNNVVVGATNEAALVAGTVYSLEYDGTDNWVMTGLTALGAVESPVVPDAL